MDQQPENQPTTPSNVFQEEANQPHAVSPEEATVVRDAAAPVAEVRENNAIEWSASEYVEHEKTNMWFVGAVLVAFALLMFAIFVIKEYTFAVLIVVMTVAVIVLAKRPAAEMQYNLSSDEISVNDKHFKLSDFRAFGVLQEGAVYYAVLLPNKRFSPGVNVYFSGDLGEQIVDVLGRTLPMEDIKPHFIDKLASRLNF